MQFNKWMHIKGKWLMVIRWC